MIRVHVICEGQTEETFVKQLLYNHFFSRGITLMPALIGKPGQKGGNLRFERLGTDVRNRLRGDSSSYCTTFFDYYGLPSGFPGKGAAASRATPEESAHCVQEAIVGKMREHVDENACRRFLPYVQMHEFEALLFSDPDKFASGIDRPDLAAHFRRIRSSYDSPEWIDDSPRTAPSKRIESLVGGYQKPIQGSLAAMEIGLDTIRRECALFNAWLERIESLAPVS